MDGNAMKQDDNSAQLTAAIQCGLATLSESELRVSASSIEALATLKSVLRALLTGELILSSPDREMPTDDTDPGPVEK